MQSTNAFARTERRNSREPGRDREHVSVGHDRYRYHNGRFYRPFCFGLFEIAVSVPPIGAVVTVLPLGHSTIMVGGTKYYFMRMCTIGPILMDTLLSQRRY
jgi:hypothetical protein